jgi:hypothetical protein
MCCIISVLFSSKCHQFHISTSFGSCIIHILNTECAKILKNSKGLWNPSIILIIMLGRRRTTTQTKPAICNILMVELTKRIYNQLLRNNILPEEQKGCCRMSRVCKDQLLLSKMITSLAKKHQRHLCMAWIDYEKAFDSLSHAWIDTVMEMYRICATMIQFLEASMKEWKTEMWLYHTKGHVKTEKWRWNGEYSKVTSFFHYCSV